jgi:hypothetical protein
MMPTKARAPDKELPKGFTDSMWDDFTHFINSNKGDVSSARNSFLKAAGELGDEFPDMADEINNSAFEALVEANKTASFSDAERVVGGGING